MEINLNSFEHKGVSVGRIQAVESAIKLIGEGFTPIDEGNNSATPFNPIKVAADWIEEALGVEDKKKQ